MVQTNSFCLSFQFQNVAFIGRAWRSGARAPLQASFLKLTEGWVQRPVGREREAGFQGCTASALRAGQVAGGGVTFYLALHPLLRPGGWGATPLSLLLGSLTPLWAAQLVPRSCRILCMDPGTSARAARLEPRAQVPCAVPSRVPGLASLARCSGSSHAPAERSLATCSFFQPRPAALSQEDGEPVCQLPQPKSEPLLVAAYTSHSTHCLRPKSLLCGDPKVWGPAVTF